jgi:hypothetical protein
MSGVWPIGFRYTVALDASAADDVIDASSIGLVNTDLTTNGVVKLTYASGRTGTIPVMAGQYVAVADARLLWKTGTTAGLLAKIAALY